MNPAAKPIHLAGTEIGHERHICAFFYKGEGEYEVLIPSVAEGIENGDKAAYIVNPATYADHLFRLSAAGVDVDRAEQTCQLEIKRCEDSYLGKGHFDQDGMLSRIEEILEQGKEQGFPLTRLVAQIEWVPEDRPSVDAHIEYEARLNYILPKYYHIVICSAAGETAIQGLNPS